MVEEVNTGGLHRFVYDKKQYSEDEDKKVRRSWGRPIIGYYDRIERNRRINKIFWIIFTLIMIGVVTWIIIKNPNYPRP